MNTDSARGEGFIRLLQTMLYLTHYSASRSQLAKIFKISSKTASRDILFLKQSGVKLERLGRGKYYIGNEWWEEFLDGSYDTSILRRLGSRE